MTAEAAAKKAKVKTEQLEAWERGESRPTFNQLRTLAGIYKRPLAVFYLPEPPQELEALRDYRRLPDATKPGESPELREEIRRAMFRREVVLELADDWEDAPPNLEASASLSENPERVAARIREILGISVDEQADWASEWVALRNWRFALEETGVLVFQASGIALREMRGFSLAERPFPVIVVNVRDRPRGRIFTLLHEFTHILLHDSGLCDLEEHEPRPPELQRIERFCDRVAAATLVPRDDFLAQPLVVEKANRPEAWDWYDLRELASRYQVSQETLLGRLLTLERIDEGFYWRTLRGLQRRYKKLPTSTSSRGPAPPLKAVNNAGHLYSQLVLDSYNEERITASDLSDYLEVRLKHIPSIEDLVRRGAAAHR